MFGGVRGWRWSNRANYIGKDKFEGSINGGGEFIYLRFSGFGLWAVGNDSPYNCRLKMSREGSSFNSLHEIRASSNAYITPHMSLISESMGYQPGYPVGTEDIQRQRIGSKKIPRLKEETGRLVRKYSKPNGLVG